MKANQSNREFDKLTGRKNVNTLQPGEAKEYQKSIQFASSFIFVLFCRML